ncbi:MAG: tetratricopeptide repeat protein [Deltaproteobacteria bacterium]|nr:tetratricopeptide repeat protein [Deltaproteobacteria bacterium]
MGDTEIIQQELETHSQTATSAPAGKPWIACAVLLLAVTGLYWPALGFEFLIYDDNVYITDNLRIAQGLSWENLRWAFSSFHYGTWQPTTWFSYLLDAQLFGVSPRAFHATNVLFHGTNSALVFLLFRRMTGRALPSFLLAALFAFHPLRVESVAWVADRKTLVCTFFGLLSLLQYRRYAETRSLRAYTGSLAFFALGLMAKPVLITLPFVFLLLDFWPLQRFVLGASGESRESQGVVIKKLLLEKLPFLVFCAGSAVLTTMAQERAGALASSEHYSLAMRLANATVSYAQYISKTLYPDQLAILYKHPGMPPLGQIAMSAAALLAITAGVLCHTRRRPYLFLGWCWFLGTLIPMSGIVQFGSHAMADRFSYIPLLGLFCMLSWGLADLTGKSAHAKKIYIGLALALVALCMARTHGQLKHWKNSETIFKHTLSVTQDNEIAHVNLGLTFAAQGRLDDALAQYRAAFAITPFDVRVHELLTEIHTRLANQLARQGNIVEAEANYREALSINPDLIDARVNLGNTLALQGRSQEAKEEYQLVLVKKADHWYAHFNLADLYYKEGNFEQAVNHYRETLRLNPKYVAAQLRLAAALHESGNEKAALEQLREAQRDHPSNEQVRSIIESVMPAARKEDSVD